MKLYQKVLAYSTLITGLSGLFGSRAEAQEGHTAEVPVVRRTVSQTTGDFDNDGNLDLVVATTYNDSRSRRGRFGDLYFLKGDGTGKFYEADLIDEVQGASKNLVLASGYINNDKNLDLIVIATDFGSKKAKMHSYLGKGDGSFKHDRVIGEIEDGDKDIAVSFDDVDNDLDLDLIVTAANHSSKKARVYVFFRDGEDFKLKDN